MRHKNKITPAFIITLPSKTQHCC